MPLGHLGHPAHVPLALEDPEIVVHHRRGADLAARLDVPNRRWELVVVQELPDELQDAVLLR